ncbi:MAG: thioredoxin domain-containing protein [Desulfobulbaceae bacterium]
MGEKPNRLIKEKSPYLLQHAFNPVDWYPWGEEAFARAKKENKPIFLSVGYSTCHWCHVMEEESFENPEIAAILNRWFICIKVDREERPDIDQLYMSATQAMTGTGGWPMSVFLFPDGKPFYAGTYFPPKAMYGRPGFSDVLLSIHEAWESRQDDLKDVATRLVDELEKRNREGGEQVERNVLGAAFKAFQADYEPEYGGFSRAPKFPRPSQFTFLLRYHHRTGNREALDMVLQTLRHMADGGLHDHVGGGFHRYATDMRWRVPHFEKMLYDQAQLAQSYLDVFLLTGEQGFAEVARGIFTYVLRDMRSPEGGFYSAEDADSEDPSRPGTKNEGAFYLWTAAELEKILTREEREVFFPLFNIRREGNALEDPQGEFKGKNILYYDGKSKGSTQNTGKNIKHVQDLTENSLKKLLEHRGKRKRPHLDDKIITSWNGLMIGALARGSAVFDDENLLAAAREAAQFVRKHLYDEEKGTLLRRYRDGHAGLAGQLDDYAFLVNGLLDLYQADQDPGWLDWAARLTRTMIDLFKDEKNGGLFDSEPDPSLPVRVRARYDGAEPAGNSVAAMNLLQLGAMLMKPEWTEAGKQVIESFGTYLRSQPRLLPYMLSVLDQSGAKPQQVIISGKKESPDTLAMLREVFTTFEPGRVVLLAEDGPNEKYLSQSLLFIGDMDMMDGKATAYVCQNFTCSMPVNSVEDLAAQLRKRPAQSPAK